MTVVVQRLTDENQFEEVGRVEDGEITAGEDALTAIDDESVWTGMSPDELTARFDGPRVMAAIRPTDGEREQTTQEAIGVKQTPEGVPDGYVYVSPDEEVGDEYDVVESDAGGTYRSPEPADDADGEGSDNNAGDINVEGGGPAADMANDLAAQGGFEVSSLPPEHLQDILGDEPETEVDIEFEPAEETPGFTEETQIAIADSPGSYGYAAFDAQADVDDFADLQAFIGTELGPGDLSERDWWDGVSEDVIDGMVDAIESGDGDIPMPYIEVGEDGGLRSTQEGRHRTLAAKEAGLEKIPFRVLVNDEREGDTPPLIGDEAVIQRAEVGTKQTPEGVPAGYNYLAPGDEPPEGHDVVESPNGATYVSPEPVDDADGDDAADAPTPDETEDASDRAETVPDKATSAAANEAAAEMEREVADILGSDPGRDDFQEAEAFVADAVAVEEVDFSSFDAAQAETASAELARMNETGELDNIDSFRSSIPETERATDGQMPAHYDRDGRGMSVDPNALGQRANQRLSEAGVTSTPSETHMMEHIAALTEHIESLEEGNGEADEDTTIEEAAEETDTDLTDVAAKVGQLSVATTATLVAETYVMARNGYPQPEQVGRLYRFLGGPSLSDFRGGDE